MKRDKKYYKFINSVTGNVIHFLSFPFSEPDAVKKLEEMRRQLAGEKGVYSANIYYEMYSEMDFDE